MYSGYAPISVRLVQCVAQKGGVLSNPALDKANKPAEGESADDPADVRNGSTKVQAHPIVGWKGFEDVLANIPGETMDFVPKGLVQTSGVNPGSIVRSKYLGRIPIVGDLTKEPQLLLENKPRPRQSSSLEAVPTQRLQPSDGLPSKIEVGGECNIRVYCVNRVLGRQVGGSSSLRRGSSVGGA